MKRVFTIESIANDFAKAVNGTVRISCLPGYMSTETVWVVEWEMKYPEWLVKRIRESLGLEPNDTSRDNDIALMSKRELLESWLE